MMSGGRCGRPLVSGNSNAPAAMRWSATQYQPVNTATIIE
jgi:hypothetical protein